MLSWGIALPGSISMSSFAAGALRKVMRLSWLGLVWASLIRMMLILAVFFDRMSRMEALDALLVYELYHLLLVCGMRDCLVSFRIALADST